MCQNNQLKWVRFFAAGFSSLALITKKFWIESASYMIWSNSILGGTNCRWPPVSAIKELSICQRMLFQIQMWLHFLWTLINDLRGTKATFLGLKNFKSQDSFQITKISSPKTNVNIWKMYLMKLRRLDIKKNIVTNFSTCSILEKSSIADRGLQFQLSFMYLWHSKNLHLPQKIPHHHSSRSIPCCCKLLKQTQWYYMKQLESKECFHNVMRKHLACAMNNNRSSNQRKSLLSTMKNNVS